MPRPSNRRYLGPSLIRSPGHRKKPSKSIYDPSASRSRDLDLRFQSPLLIIPRLPAGSHLWVGAVIRADDGCAQLFTHLPGQQTVTGSLSRAPRASIDEDHQRRRPIVQPAHVRREVQVQFLAPPAKSDALQSVHSVGAFSIHAHYGISFRPRRH